MSDAVKHKVVKKTEYNAKIKDIEDKIPDITNLATNNTLNAKRNEVKCKIPTITNLATTTALTAVKIPNVSNLVKKLTITQKSMKLKKITDHDHSNKYITTQEFNNVTKFCCKISTNKFSKQKGYC